MELIWQHLLGRRAEQAIVRWQSVPHVAVSMLAFIKSIMFGNPWNILADHKQEILTAPDCGKCLAYLITQAELLRQSFLRNGYEDDLEPDLNGMVDTILGAAKARLAIYEKWEEEDGLWKERLKLEGELKRKPLPMRRHAIEMSLRRNPVRQRPVCGDWPADIYRDLGEAIRMIAETWGHPEARRVWKRLSLEATLPISEMENPPHIDGYTGEAEPEEEVISIRFHSDAGNEELGWTPEDQHAFYLAQSGGYNADADEITYQDDGMSDGEEKDFTFQKDLAVTEQGWELVERYSDAVHALEQLWKRLHPTYLIATDGDVEAAIHEVKASVLASEESLALLHQVQEDAAWFAPQDILMALMPILNDFAWGEEELASISTGSMSLLQWFQDNEEAFLEQVQSLNDAPMRMTDIFPEEVDAYSRETIWRQVLAYSTRGMKAAYRQATGDENARRAAFWKYARVHPGHSPKSHPCFLVGQLIAAQGGADELGQIASGWEYYRQMICPEGNKAYHAARAAGLDNGEAMRSFWEVFRRAFPATEQILVVKKTGLVVRGYKGTRTINWDVAAIKVKKGEIELEPVDRERLKTALRSRKIGGVLLSAL